eukprot:COSAG06_NODE_52873_length_303_cov_0.823529_1_plen_47_part_10
MSCTRTVLSSDPDASHRPHGLQLNAVTQACTFSSFTPSHCHPLQDHE